MATSLRTNTAATALRPLTSALRPAAGRQAAAAQYLIPRVARRYKSGPYGYTQAKALVFSKEGEPSDVLQYVVQQPLILPATLPLVERTKLTLVITDYTHTPSPPRSPPPQSSSAPSRRPSTRPTLTPFRAHTAPSPPLHNLSAPLNPLRSRETRASSRSCPWDPRIPGWPRATG